MFGNLGELGSLMSKFGEIQKNMKQMKADMEAATFVGKDLEGKVVVEMGGDLTVKGVHIDPSMMVSGQSAVLEQACNQAFADVLRQFREQSKQKLLEATGGLNIPGLM